VSASSRASPGPKGRGPRQGGASQGRRGSAQRRSRRSQSREGGSRRRTGRGSPRRARTSQGPAPPVQKIYVADQQDPSEILDAIELEAQRQRVPVQVISMARLDREARTEGHQGVMAIAARLETVGLDVLLKTGRAFLLVCDGVTDPRNLGAMLRSADGAGVTGVVVPRHRGGAHLAVGHQDRRGGDRVLDVLRRRRRTGGDRSTQQGRCAHRRSRGESRDSIYDLDLGSQPVALVVGGEEKGLSALTRKRCARGRVDSPTRQDQLTERRRRSFDCRVRGRASTGCASMSEVNLKCTSTRNCGLVVLCRQYN
jgi:23S rRNA (guanosine2251-2'-O)-methyltransferase